MEIWGLLITGGVAAAGIKLIETVTTLVLNRRLGKRRNVESEIDQVKHRLDDLAVGQRVILHDRIKFLGRAYIKDGGIDLDDRKDLIDMHGVYHDTLDGNGNLDALMKQVLKLPLSDN